MEKEYLISYLWVSANMQIYSKKKIPECSLVARIWRTAALKHARLVLQVFSFHPLLMTVFLALSLAA